MKKKARKLPKTRAPRAVNEGAAEGGRARGIRRLTLQATVLEDLHTGTGARSTTVDAVQIRDRHGRPAIPRTHVRGVLRQSAEALERLDPRLAGKTAALFGREGPNGGAFSCTGLYRDASAADTLVWTAAARKADDRAPADDTLHTVEFIPAGTRLTMRIELADRDLEDFLRTSVRHTAALGGKRNRGAGRVRFEWLDEKVAPRRPPARDPTHRRLRLLLRALDPLSLPATGAPGNLVRTDCYARGQTMRGALAAWLFRNGKGEKAALLLDDPTQVRVSDAYPTPDGVVGGRLVDIDIAPAPLTARRRKPGGQPDEDWPWWTGTGGVPGTEPGHKLASLAGLNKHESKRPADTEFIARRGELWERFQPLIGVHMRNQSPDRDRPGSQPQLFATEVIAEETRFLMDVDFATRDLAPIFATLFESVLKGEAWLRLGRHGAPVVVERAEWCGSPAPASTSGKRGTFNVVLQSDLIARAPNLCFRDTLDAAALAELAGTSADAGTVEVVDAVTDVVTVYGFNAVSGLPRAPALAIRRGSVFSVSGPGAGALHAALVQRLHQGLGERTWDGFGRFRIDFDPKLVSRVAAPVRADQAIAGQEALIATATQWADRLAGLSRTQWMQLWEWGQAGDAASALAAAAADGQRRRSAWNDARQQALRQAIQAAPSQPEQFGAFMDYLVRFGLLTASADRDASFK